MSKKNQEKRMLNNQDALKELEKTIANLESQYKTKEEELNNIRITLIKSKGAQDVLNQIEEGIEVDDTKSTD
jgi:molecular chaperone GrpE (heat shock protein)